MADTDASTDGTTAFSRSTGLPSTLGKATEVLKTRVPDAVKWSFVELAHELGMDESSLLRDLVMVRLYGREGVARMQAAQLAKVTGSGPEKVAQP